MLIFACLLVVYMVDYCHGDEGDIDPFNMINHEQSTETMKEKKVQASMVLFLILLQIWV